MHLLPDILIWLFLSFWVAVYGHWKGHSAILFFGAAFALSPVIGLMLAVMIEINHRELERRRIEAGEKKCPVCAELVKGEALVCRYCRTPFEIAESPEYEHSSRLYSGRN